MPTAPGLRERKKERTRHLIASTARRLFVERGFDVVSVAEIARAAEVSEGTVFNYFPTKEDIFFGGMETFDARLVSMVRDRTDGDSVLDAFRRVVLDGTRRLASGELADLMAESARVIASSRLLRARERDIGARFTEELATLIALERRRPADDVEAAAVAAALMGVQRALVAFVHARAQRGVRGPKLATSAKAQARRAFARLERGLGGYGVRARKPAK